MYKNKINSISRFGGSAKLKKIQSKRCAIQKQKDLCIKRLIYLRNCVLKANNLPTIDYGPQLLLREARVMRSVYLMESKRAGFVWQTKKHAGATTGLHSWWSCLYGTIEVCMSRMGIDPDLGFLHECNKGFVYDIADVIKPLMIKNALLSEPFNTSGFWKEFKALRIKSLLPQLILLVLKNKDVRCSWPRSHRDHVERRKDISTP